jgi:Ca-activated chloride channel family protein
VQALRGLANRGNGNYTTMTHNNKDIEKLTLAPLMNETEESKKTDNTGDQWQEFGPYLLLLVLPMLLSYFRRGALLMTLPFALMFIPNNNAQADVWQDLWKTKDQQGQEHFKSEQYQQAAQEFKDPLWQGSAHYKAGDYEQALATFQQVDSADALFNQGNALAKLQRLDEAMAAYDKALQRDPNFADAKKNKKIIEQVKQQQKKNQEQQSGDDQQQQDKDKDQQGDNQDGKNQDNESDDQQSQQQEQQSSDQQSSDEQNSDQKNQENESSEQNDAEQKEEQQQQQAEADKQESTEEQQAKSAQQAEDADKPTDEKSLQAQQLAEELAKETEQKHQQLLNKVTDDPYRLLRNNMQLEYQKRHQDRRNIGVKKKW